MTDPAVLVVTGEWPCLSETFILRDLQALKAQGFPFVLVAVRGSVGVEFGGIAADVILTEQGPKDDIGAPPKQKPTWIRHAGRKWHHRHAITKLRDTVRCRDIRHIHAAHLDLPGYLVGHVARSLNLTFSLEGHARDIYCSKFPLQALCRGASYVSVCNEAARTALNKQVDNPNIILLHHAGPEPAKKHLHKNPATHILFVGRFVPKKGVLEAIRITNHLAEESGRPVHLRIIGDGPQADAVRAATRQVSPLVTCELIGQIDQQAVRHSMTHWADLLLLPAQLAADGDRDGIPNVILEAMAVGLPVAATQVGGIDEVLTSETGWPIQDDKLESAALAVQSLLSQPTETEARAQRAKTLVSQSFSPEIAAQTRINLWRPLISNKP